MKIGLRFLWLVAMAGLANGVQAQQVAVRQVAGAMARRIVTYAEPGVEANISDHLGFIKFGSRVDIYLPPDARPLVRLGEGVCGGVTQIALLNPYTEEQ